MGVVTLSARPRATKMTSGIHLRTGLVLDEHGRIRPTREPGPAPVPPFTPDSRCVELRLAYLRTSAEKLAAEPGRLAGGGGARATLAQITIRPRAGMIG
jgi:hypothetical protein